MTYQLSVADDIDLVAVHSFTYGSSPAITAASPSDFSWLQQNVRGGWAGTQIE